MPLHRDLVGLRGHSKAAEHFAFRIEQRRRNAKDAGAEFSDRDAVAGLADGAQRAAERLPVRAETGRRDGGALTVEQRAQLMRRQMRQGNYTVTFDRDFEGVIVACAGHRQDRWRLTWITPKIMRTYAGLFDAGYAHSFEVWNESGNLAGGGYGIHWSEIDEDISTEGLLRRAPSPEARLR